METEGGHSPSDRRWFFRAATSRVLRPVADYLDRRFEFSKSDRPLRPPGAIDELRLIDTCQRCGACVDVCPADAIFPLPQSAGDAAGTPAVDPDRAACVVCEGIKCTTVCPSGALQTILDPRLIRMGLAEVYRPLCVRSQDEDCTECVDRCPLGSEAITFVNEGPPVVMDEGCVGCGVCQQYCPTSPKAIVVRPN